MKREWNKNEISIYIGGGFALNRVFRLTSDVALANAKIIRMIKASAYDWTKSICAYFDDRMRELATNTRRSTLALPLQIAYYREDSPGPHYVKRIKGRLLVFSRLHIDITHTCYARLKVS